MQTSACQQMLTEAGIRPTPNRLLVLRELTQAKSPLSLIDLETRLGSVEKSSVHRVLMLLMAHGLTHAIEDGRGITRYEICHGANHHHSAADMHPHFFCLACSRTFCLDTVAIPPVNIPAGYTVSSLNYMLKGICPECSKQKSE